MKALTHPFEVLKYCPRCGSGFFRRSSEKSIQCDECGFHFFYNAAAAVAALIPDEQGRLMLVKRALEPDYGKLDLPGGFVDPGETVEVALVRELYEELGLKVKSLKYFESAPNEYVISGLTVFTMDLAFLAVPENLDGLHARDDVLSFKFYAENEIDYNEIPAPSIKKFVKNFFNGESN